MERSLMTSGDSLSFGFTVLNNYFISKYDVTLKNKCYLNFTRFDKVEIL